MVLPTVIDPVAPTPPPRAGVCVGRAVEVDSVVRHWLDGRAVAVVGGPGIGKSTVLAQALGEQPVVAKYGSRRFVVSCDGADTARALVDKVAQALGVGLGEHLVNRVIAFVHRSPCVLVLDNFETVADGDPRGAAELVATLRAEGGSVTLGVGFRGAAAPVTVLGADALEVPLSPLPLDRAVEVFVAFAGERHSAHPATHELVGELDGIPLAIALLGALARAERDLGGLVSAWRAKRSDLLRHWGVGDRTSSLPVSLELSWDRLSDDARTAFSLAALLPDGWPDGRPHLYLPESLSAGVIELGHRGLLHDDPPGRRRCLNPVRQHIATHHPPTPDALDALLQRVADLARHGNSVGSADGGQGAAMGASEFTNIVDTLRAFVTSHPNLAAAVPNILKFQQFTGLGDDHLGQLAIDAAPSTAARAAVLFSLGHLYVARGANDRARDLYDRALPLYRRVGDVVGEANTLFSVGQLAFLESDHETARDLFNQALPLYRRVGDVLGEANTLFSVGELAFRESDNDRARDRYNEALPLYRRVGDVLGEANTLCSLGELAFLESDNDRARDLYNEALALYRRVGAVHGEANTLRGLGQLAIRESDHETARDRYDQALPLYRRVGDVLGEANTLRSLGELAFFESDHETARDRYNEALPLYRRVGDVLGEANTLFSVGQLAFFESDHETARDRYNEALPLYRRVGDVLGEANTLRGLGELAFRESDNDTARDLYNQALPLYRRVKSRYSQAVTHAWLARVSDGPERSAHCAAVEQLTADRSLAAHRDRLRSFSGCELPADE